MAHDNLFPCEDSCGCMLRRFTHRAQLDVDVGKLESGPLNLLRTIFFRLNINQVIWSFINRVIQHVILFDTYF